MVRGQRSLFCDSTLNVHRLQLALEFKRIASYSFYLLTAGSVERSRALDCHYRDLLKVEHVAAHVEGHIKIIENTTKRSENQLQLDTMIVNKICTL